MRNSHRIVRLCFLILIAVAAPGGIGPAALVGGRVVATAAGGRTAKRPAFVPNAAPAAQEYAQTVEIIRGDKRSREVVSQE